MKLVMDRVIDLKDTLVDNLYQIYEQLQWCDGNKIEELLDRNVVWKYEGVTGAVPFTGVYTGKAGVKNFWKTYFKSLMSPRTALRYYLHQGKVIDLHLTEEGIIPATGKKYAMETVQRWEFNDKGKVVKFRWYNDTYALYHAFQPNTDPQLSTALHPADYHITCNGPVDALAIIQSFYNDFAAGNLAGIIKKTADNVVFIITGPEGLTKIAGTWLGRKGLITFFKTLFQNETYNKFNLMNFIADGCSVDVEFEEEIVILTTGKVVAATGLHSLTVNSKGQLVRFRSYNDSYSCALGYTAD